MVFNSFQFLWLFPLIFLAYWLISGLLKTARGLKMVNVFLLLTSYGLYAQWKPAYAFLLLGVSIVTYVGALVIEKKREDSRSSWLIAVFALLALLPLLVFKYYDFINESVAGLLMSIGIASRLPGLNWALPVGISFFTFQALGYLFDVSRGRIAAERNLIDYLLFVSFFPQILSGPISRAADLLPQIKSARAFDYGRAVAALKLLLWGMFLKVVMADRLGLYVDAVFGNWQYNSGISCFVASLAYSLQIYGDFAGYSLMAVAVGKLLGFELVNNFRRPYFAVSITDFWCRWHISLSTWLRDYVYIPLGGSRCSRLRNYLNILVTFLVSGIWHGANWTFILWGLLHSILQIAEKAFGLQKYEGRSLAVRSGRILLTFLTVNFLWTIFRMPTIGDALGVFHRMLTAPGTILLPNAKDVLFSIMAAGIVVTADALREFFPGSRPVLDSRRCIVRWTAYCILLVLILFCGVLDSGQFIYVSF